ncbi:MAG: plastocyanin/azurin family copper-binding protein [Chloroflexota bacterium]
MPTNSGTPMGSGMGTFGFGQPADASRADRTIEVIAHDNFTFDPDQISITVGETVTFRVRNAGAVAHELILGPIAMQQEHETRMQAMPSGMMMADEPNAIIVPSEETRELTWTFTQAGTFQYGCHEPDHYANGMFGTITVTGS